MFRPNAVLIAYQFLYCDLRYC